MSKIDVIIDGKSFVTEVRQNPANRAEFTVLVDGKEIPVYLPASGNASSLEWIVIGGQSYDVLFDQDLHWVQGARDRYRLEIRDAEAATATQPVSGDGRVKSPIPGLITRIMVEPGQIVQTGQPLLILEAMKMENEIRATRAGVVQQLNVQPGQSVPRDVLLVEIG